MKAMVSSASDSNAIFIYSFIHSGHFCSGSSSPLLLRSAPDTARILCQNFTPKHHRQLRVKDLLKAPTWRLERDSNPRPFGQKSSTQPMRCHVPRLHVTVPGNYFCLGNPGMTVPVIKRSGASIPL